MERRYCIRDEVWRLEVVLKGHYLDECEFRRKSNRDLRDLIEFYHSKRPYGNKNIPKSIAYQLGWDPALIIGKSSLAGNETFPPHIEKEAMTCHDLLLVELKKG